MSSRIFATPGLPTWMLTLVCALLLMPTAWSATCSVRNPERFIDFLPTFTDTKRFAMERTVLPLPLLHWGAGEAQDAAPDVGELSAQEYRRWPTMAKLMNDRELLSRVSAQTQTSATVELFKDDTPGLVRFQFELKAGCWYLRQYEVRES